MNFLALYLPKSNAAPKSKLSEYLMFLFKTGVASEVWTLGRYFFTKYANLDSSLSLLDKLTQKFVTIGEFMFPSGKIHEILEELNKIENKGGFAKIFKQDISTCKNSLNLDPKKTELLISCFNQSFNGDDNNPQISVVNFAICYKPTPTDAVNLVNKTVAFVDCVDKNISEVTQPLVELVGDVVEEIN